MYLIIFFHLINMYIIYNLVGSKVSLFLLLTIGIEPITLYFGAGFESAVSTNSTK